MRGVEHAVECMSYPYGYIKDSSFSYYSVNEILKPILVETRKEKADAGDFPHNIQEHFWIRPGENDGDSWISCGILDNGAYFYYTGGCDYTGFDCQGGMTLYVSKKWENIINHAMGLNYHTYIAQTEVPPAEGEAPWPSMTNEEFWMQYRGSRDGCNQCKIEEGVLHDDITGKLDVKLCYDCYFTLKNSTA